MKRRGSGCPWSNACSPHFLVQCRLSAHERLEMLVDKPTQVLDIKGIKPLRALQMLRENLRGDADRQELWLANARVASVMGSCPRSKANFRSGVRHWLEFVEITHGAARLEQFAFPPALGDVLAWANLFACLSAIVCEPHRLACGRVVCRQAPSATTSLI